MKTFIDFLNESKDTLSLWSKRWTTARGWEWKKERDVTPETADQWLKTWQKDEPKVEFKISAKKPKV